MERWNTKLADAFEDVTLAVVSRKLGFSKNRLYVIIHEGQVPNAIDAVKICRYLGTTVENIFGEDAAAQLAKIRPATKAEADRAAQRALEEALTETMTGQSPSKQSEAKVRGRRKKTG